jgi:hypothetical protein
MKPISICNSNQPFQVVGLNPKRPSGKDCRPTKKVTLTSVVGVEVYNGHNLISNTNNGKKKVLSRERKIK